MTTAVAGPMVRLRAGRVAAALVASSAGVHVLLVDGTSLASLVMVTMAAVCLPCAWHLWRAPTAAVWGTTATLDVGMLALHGQMLATAHHPPGSLMWLGLALVGGQLALAATAGVRQAARQQAGTSPAAPPGWSSGPPGGSLAE